MEASCTFYLRRERSCNGLITSASSHGTANAWFSSASLHSLAKHYQPLMRALYGLEDVQGAVGKYFMVSI